MKDFTVYINEKLKITKDVLKQNKHNYYPKTKNELTTLIDKLIEERGIEANLNDIDTSEITDMSALFKNSNFNGDISGWDVKSVIKMEYMFYDSKFTGENGGISKWNVGEVVNMKSMFMKSKFNGNISKWDVRKVGDMEGMFFGSSFNTDISNWDISSITNMDYMFDGCPIKEEYKPKFKK